MKRTLPVNVGGSSKESNEDDLQKKLQDTLTDDLVELAQKLKSGVMSIESCVKDREVYLNDADEALEKSTAGVKSLNTKCVLWVGGWVVIDPRLRYRSSRLLTLMTSPILTADLRSVKKECPWASAPKF